MMSKLHLINAPINVKPEDGGGGEVGHKKLSKSPPLGKELLSKLAETNVYFSSTL